MILFMPKRKLPGLILSRVTGHWEQWFWKNTNVSQVEASRNFQKNFAGDLAGYKGKKVAPGGDFLF